MFMKPVSNMGNWLIFSWACTIFCFCECRSFVREIYDGQVFVKLKKGVDLPAMDPWVCKIFYALCTEDLMYLLTWKFSFLLWLQFSLCYQGTSDPYVVMELDGQVVKSKIKWGYILAISLFLLVLLDIFFFFFLFLGYLLKTVEISIIIYKARAKSSSNILE